jgi:hypothetical protein
LLYDSSNSRLYVGGSFTTVGDAGQADQSANNVAYWNISTSRWAKLGTTDVSYNNGTNAYVNTLAYDGSYNRLYVGGNFTTARDVSNINISMNYVGYWNVSTSKWGQLGGTTSSTNGVNAQCRTLVYDSRNAELYVGGNFTTAYNSSGSSSVNYSVKWGVSSSAWYALGGGSRTYTLNGSSQGINSGELRAIAYYNSIIYVGGSFTSVNSTNSGSVSANRVAAYNISSGTWSALGSGVGEAVYAFAVDSSNQKLYVGGGFTSAGGVSARNYVAVWNISNSTWSALGSGVGSTVYSVELDNSNNKLYVGGNFTTAGGVSSRTGVAVWDISTSAWSGIGSVAGGNPLVYRLALDSSKQKLYVGGYFTSAGGVSASNVAVWNITNSTWSALSSGVGNTSSQCMALSVDSSNQKLYVGGGFTSAGGVSANNVAVWDISNSTWSALGSGVVTTNFVYAFAVDSSNQKLYVGGLISSAGGTSANNVAVWNITTSTWSALGTGLNSYVFALALDSTNNELYIGGGFTSAGGVTANSVAIYSITNSTYYPVGNYIIGPNNGTNGQVYSFSLDTSNNRLYAGGNFTSTSDSTTSSQTANYIAYWNIATSRWTQMGGSTSTTNGTNALVSALALDQSKNAFLGGNFTKASTTAGDTSANYGIVWTPSTANWSNLGVGLYRNGLTDGSCIALSLDSSNQRIYVGGSFTRVRDTSNVSLSANRIAYWDLNTSSWSILGTTASNGTNAYVDSLELDTSNNRVYVGGNFTSTSDATTASQSANYVVYWNIATGRWIQMGGTTATTNGTNTLVSALVLDFSKNAFIGGNFTKASTTAGDTSANYGIVWTPSTANWSNLGATYYRNGLTDGSCNALALDSSNQRLYVGGSFTSVKDTSNISLSTNRIAYWDLNTSAWYGLGTTDASKNGVDASVNALAFDSSANRLYVGGNFKKMSDSSKIDQSANYVAFWDASNSLWGQLGGTDISKNGVDASVNALAFDSITNILFVGGNFLNAYDSSFTFASPLKSQYLATWNPSTQRWTQIGYSSSSTASLYGLSNICRALASDPSKAIIYVGGDHTTTCDSSNISADASNIAYINLNTGNIYPLGTAAYNGTNSIVNNIKVDTNNNVVYVDGSFTAVYDSSNRDLSANYIAKYDVSTKTWSRMGIRTSNGLGGMGKALFYDNINNAVYASGNFNAVRDSTTDVSKNFNYVAKWDVAKSAWSPLGSYGNGTNGTILAYAYDAANYRVFCGGSFTQVYDNSNTTLYAKYVAMFDIITSTWSVLGASDVSYNNGLNLECRTIIYDASNSQLYVGGDFTAVRDGRGVDISANRVAIWKLTESKWYGFGTLGQNGTNGQILTYAYDSCKNVMYAGGTFTTVFDTSNIMLSANRIAKWDLATSTWTRLGTSSSNGVDGSCNALAMDTSNQILYIGGNFTNVYDAAGTLANTQEVAKWTVETERWTRLGESTATTNGLTSTSAYCNALLYDSSNSRLYVGGNFTKVGDAGQADQSANNVAYWNISTSRWAKLGTTDVSYNNGTNAYVNALAYDGSYNRLYVGGNFTKARDVSSIDISMNYVGYWDISTDRKSVV